MGTRDCETVEEFRNEALALFSVTVAYHTSLCPGDSITFRGDTIRYTPKPPPPIGCMRDEHIDALKRDGRFVLNGETILYEATPPPATKPEPCVIGDDPRNAGGWVCRYGSVANVTPRDEAREAWPDAAIVAARISVAILGMRPVGRRDATLEEAAKVAMDEAEKIWASRGVVLAGRASVKS